MNRCRWVACGLAIGGIAAWQIFANTDMAGVFEILESDIDYLFAGSALLAYSLFFVGKALRWRYLLKPMVEVAPLRLTAYVLIGYAGNVLLPFQAGEVARGYLLSKHHEVRLVTALSGIALEKALDFFALLLLLIWALLAIEAPSPLAENVAMTLACLLSLIGLLLVAALIRPEATAAVIDQILAYCPIRLAASLRPLAHDAITGLAALRKGALLAKLVVASLATWGIMLAALCLTIEAVQVDASVAIAVVVLVLAAVGLALPTGPGFIGTLQAAFVLGMVPFGVPQEAAVAASLLYQALTTIPPLAAGAICWAWL
ncbi:MAG: lysylphosphatidylglycerol synthase transmembrane domain-containing protein [Kiloniellaceae bacterium]